MARQFGSIGKFYCIEKCVDALDESDARDAAWDELQADGYEIHHYISIEEYESEPDDNSDEEWPPVQDDMCEGDYLRFD